MPSDVNQTYQSGDQQYSCQVKPEFGLTDVFSGVYSSSRWLTFDQIKLTLSNNGFKRFDLLRDSDERFGKRFTAIASR
jgi:hypothetical protein